jgi:hypothetical protein
VRASKDFNPYLFGSFNFHRLLEFIDWKIKLP